MALEATAVAGLLPQLQDLQWFMLEAGEEAAEK